MLKTLVAVSAATTVLVCGSAAAQQKWDMPTGYPSNNFHTENIVRLPQSGQGRTAGKLKITVLIMVRCSRPMRSSAPCKAGRPILAKSSFRLFERRSHVRDRLDSVPGDRLSGGEKALGDVSKAATAARLASKV